MSLQTAGLLMNSCGIYSRTSSRSGSADRQRHPPWLSETARPAGARAGQFGVEDDAELVRERWWISTATTLAVVPANSCADTGNVNHAVC